RQRQVPLGVDLRYVRAAVAEGDLGSLQAELPPQLGGEGVPQLVRVPVLDAGLPARRPDGVGVAGGPEERPRRTPPCPRRPRRVRRLLRRLQLGPACRPACRLPLGLGSGWREQVVIARRLGQGRTCGGKLGGARLLVAVVARPAQLPRPGDRLREVLRPTAG